MLNPNLFVATQDDDRWVCRPSALVAHLHVTLGAAMSGFLLFLASTFFRAGNNESAWVGAIVLLLAGLVAGLAVWAWRSRRTPLTAERTGRVCYGDQELCAAGRLRAIEVRYTPSGERDWDVCLQLDGGQRVELPGRFFAAFGGLDETRVFARELASASGVPVKDHTSA